MYTLYVHLLYISNTYYDNSYGCTFTIKSTVTSLKTFFDFNKSQYIIKHNKKTALITRISR